MLPYMTIMDIISLSRNNFSFKTENKAFYVLTCRIAGESLFFYNNEEHLVTKGDVLYIPAGASYSQICKQETVICFHLNISGHVSLNMELFPAQDREKICRLFVRAAQLWDARPANYELTCMSILYEIMANTHIFDSEQAPHSTPLLRSAIAYLEAHIFDPDFSLEQVCKEAHISRTYFNRLFQETYHCTPIAYINRQRIERTKQLVLAGSFSNEEIAKLCGFHDVKYFYILFKKHTGFTTKEYRKQMTTTPFIP